MSNKVFLAVGFLLIITSSRTAFAQRSTRVGATLAAPVAPDAVVIAELRYGNNTPVFWDNNFKFKFYYFKNGQRRDIKVIPDKKEPYYKSSQGTEIVFIFDKDFMANKGDIEIIAEYYNRLNSNSLELDSKRVYSISIDNNGKLCNATSIGLNVYKLNYPVEITGPELFSLSSMINYIDAKINENSTRKNGFSNTVDQLQRIKNDLSYDNKIKYENMIDFYRMLVFVQDYAEEKSFFHEEGKKLGERISVLNTQLSDTLSQKNDKFYIFRQREIADELIKSNVVYQEYLKTDAVILNYFSQLQLILFFKSK